MNSGKTHLAVFGPFYYKCNFNRKEIISFFFPHLQESIEVRNDFSFLHVSARCKLLRPPTGAVEKLPNWIRFLLSYLPVRSENILECREEPLISSHAQARGCLLPCGWIGYEP